MSGGRSPWAMLAILGELEGMPWSRTELFQVDERIAAPAARTATSPRWSSASRWSTSRRCARCRSASGPRRGRPRVRSLPARPLDLVHLGLGPDGHTASLVPGDPVLDGGDRRVALTETSYQDHRRMTLTYPALAAARRIVWLVTGAEKREALAKLLAGDPSIPAGRVENGEMIVIADRRRRQDREPRAAGRWSGCRLRQWRRSSPGRRRASVPACRPGA